MGLILFLIKFSRPDISNAVRELTKVNDGATQENFKQMLRTVKCVLDTRTKTLKFNLTEKKKKMNYGKFMIIVIVITTVTKKQESALVDSVFLYWGV